MNSGQEGRQVRDTRITLEKCDVTSSGAEKLDANADGRPEVVLVKEKGKDLCRTADLNLDGRVDRTVFYDDAGKIRRVESDYDRDGRVDEIALLEGGTIKEKRRATTLDGKLDTWDYYSAGQVTRTERDENGDGVIDQWWEYPSRGCPLIHVDADGDGRPDPGASVDYCKETGYAPPPLPEEQKAKKQDFGKQERVEELSNVAADQDTGVGAEQSTGNGADAEASEEKSGE